MAKIRLRNSLSILSRHGASSAVVTEDAALDEETRTVTMVAVEAAVVAESALVATNKMVVLAVVKVLKKPPTN